MGIIYTIIEVFITILLSLVIVVYLVFSYRIYKVRKKSDFFSNKKFNNKK